MALINGMDAKLTTQDKVKNLGKDFQILQNSITFSFKKKDLGIDDTIKRETKAFIFSNSNLGKTVNHNQKFFYHIIIIIKLNI